MGLTMEVKSEVVVGRFIARLTRNLLCHYYVMYNLSPAAIDPLELQKPIFDKYGRGKMPRLRFYSVKASTSGISPSVSLHALHFLFT